MFERGKHRRALDYLEGHNSATLEEVILALQLKTSCYRELSRHDKAKEHYEKLLEHTKRGVDQTLHYRCLISFARYLEDLSDFRQALLHYQEATLVPSASKEDLCFAYLKIAKCHSKHKNHARAGLALEQVIALEEEEDGQGDVKDHLRLAANLFFDKIKDYAKAEKYAQRWLALEPRSAEALFLLAECQVGTGKLEEALQTY